MMEINNLNDAQKFLEMRKQIQSPIKMAVCTLCGNALQQGKCLNCGICIDCG